MSLRKFTIAAALTLAGVLAASAAHAGPDVHWQLRVETPVIRLPGHVSLPLPPIVVPRAVVVAPRHEASGPVGPRRGDVDGDGVPNRHDRVYNPRWDRDGDGVPNRRDPVYNPRWDRDGDGVPNHRDPHPDRAYDGRGWRGHDRHDWREERREDWRRDGRDGRHGR